MARQTATLALLVCALIAAGPASADDYDDAQAGRWDEGDTWGTTPNYPVTSDNVIIDDYDVELPMGYVVPALGSFTIGGTGRLWCSASQTDCFTVEAAVTMTDGGEIWVQNGGAYNQYATLKGGLDVSGTVTLRNHDSNSRITIQDNPLTNHADTDVIHALGQNIYDGGQGIWLMTANTSLTAQWQVEKNRLHAMADGALGTGTISLSRSAVHVKVDQSVNGPSIVAPAGSYIYVEGDDRNLAVNVSWANNPTLYLTSSYIFLRRGSQWNCPIDFGDGTTTIDTEWGYSSSNTILGGALSSTADAHVLFKYRYQPSPIVLSGDNSGFRGTFETLDQGHSGDDLVFKAASAVGNAAHLIVGAATRAVLDNDTDADWALSADLSGGGTIVVEDGSYSLTCQGNKLLPDYTGALTVSGTVVLASGSGPATLYAGIRPVYTDTVITGWQNRKLVVNGNVELSGGRLHVALSEETGTVTLPDVQGQVFTVLECDEDLVTSGDKFGSVVFDAFGGFQLGGPVEYGYDAGSTTGTVTVEVTIKADANCDLEVDVLDLAAIANNFGQPDRTWRHGDFDYDGDVDVLDLAALANNFGKDATGGGDGAPVPEPACLALLAAGSFFFIRRRRR